MNQLPLTTQPLAPTFNVVKSIMTKSGTYNPVVSRPYTATTDNGAISLFSQATHDGQRVNRHTLAGVAGMFIAPSTEAQGFIGVQNGWDNTRVIFMMEIEEINLGQSCVIMGYADKLDLSHGGLLDPELKLFINSTITLQRVQATTPNGIVYRKHIADNSHLLGVNNVQALNVYSQPSPYGMPNNTGGVEKIYLQRPMDITTNLSTTFMSSSQLLSDGRTMLFPGRQANSKRMNNSAPSYLSEVINGIREGFADDAVMNRSSESMEIYNTVTDSIEESNPTGNHIMRYITHNSNLAVQGFVTWGQMCRMFPDLDPKTDLFFMDNLPTQISGAHFESAAGRYEDWAVASYETIIATTILQTLPSILSQCMLTGYAGMFTNDTVDSLPAVATQDARSFVDEFDRTGSVTYLEQRILSEIMPAITRGNQFPVRVVVNLNLIRDGYIGVSYNGGPLVEFSAPCFADGLTIPTITNNQYSLEAISGVVNSLATFTN